MPTTESLAYPPGLGSAFLRVAKAINLVMGFRCPRSVYTRRECARPTLFSCKVSRVIIFQILRHMEAVLRNPSFA